MDSVSACLSLQLWGSSWTWNLTSQTDLRRRIVNFSFVQLFPYCEERRPPRSLPAGLEIASLTLALFQVNGWSIRGLYEENIIVAQGVVGSLHPFPFRVITEHWKADLYPHYRSQCVGVTSPRWKQLTQVSYLGEMRLGHLDPWALSLWFCRRWAPRTKGPGGLILMRHVASSCLSLSVLQPSILSTSLDRDSKFLSLFLHNSVSCSVGNDTPKDTDSSTLWPGDLAHLPLSTSLSIQKVQDAQWLGIARKLSKWRHHHPAKTLMECRHPPGSTQLSSTPRRHISLSLSGKHTYWNLRIHHPVGRSLTTDFWPKLASALQTTMNAEDKETNDGMRTEDLWKNLKSECGAQVTDT